MSSGDLIIRMPAEMLYLNTVENVACFAPPLCLGYPVPAANKAECRRMCPFSKSYSYCDAVISRDNRSSQLYV